VLREAALFPRSFQTNEHSSVNPSALLTGHSMGPKGYVRGGVHNSANMVQI